MRFSGRVYRDGSWWLAEVPVFEAATQGRTRRGALEMMEDWFASMVNEPGFAAETHFEHGDHFEITASDLKAMIRLLLQRQRQRSGLTLEEVAERLGVNSRNAYSRYERGESVPTIEKLDQLLRAVSADRDLVVGESSER